MWYVILILNSWLYFMVLFCGGYEKSISRIWDKTIPPEEGCLLYIFYLLMAVWYFLLSSCLIASLIMTSQCKAKHFPWGQWVVSMLEEHFLANFSLKRISEWGLIFLFLNIKSRQINLSLRWKDETFQPQLPPQLVFVTLYHPWLRFVSLHPILVLDSINQALLSFGSTAI